jgi:hypothetical protein
VVSFVSDSSIELKFSQPLKSENLTNLFCKSDSQMLCAGFKLHSPEIARSGFGQRPAEYRRKPAGAQTKKRSFFRANRHFPKPSNEKNFSHKVF